MRIQSRLSARSIVLFYVSQVSGQQERRQPPPLPDGVEAHLDIPYADTDHPRQRLDLYLPEARASDKLLPVIAFIHGGAWRAGNKEGGRGQVLRFARSGEYAGVSIGYRLSSDAVWPAQIHDCKAAIRWLRAHAAEYNLDPDRIGVMGSSAGGHLVAMLGVSNGVEDLAGDVGPDTEQPSGVTCVVDLFGPTDLLTMNDYPSRIDHDSPNSPESLLIGGAIQRHPDTARAASPLSYVTRDDAPILIIHGTDDPLVPFNQSEQFLAALKQAGVESYLIPVEGGHTAVSTTGRSIDASVTFSTVNCAAATERFRPRLSGPGGAVRIERPTDTESIPAVCVKVAHPKCVFANC
jgi:acetyl esterase/lipase